MHHVAIAVMLCATATFTYRRAHIKGLDTIGKSNMALATSLLALDASSAVDQQIYATLGISGTVTASAYLGISLWAATSLHRLRQIQSGQHAMIPTVLATAAPIHLGIWFIAVGHTPHNFGPYDGISVVATVAMYITALAAHATTGRRLLRSWNGPARAVGWAYLIAAALGCSAAAIPAAVIILGGNPNLLSWWIIPNLGLGAVPVVLSWANQHGLTQNSTRADRRRLTFSLADGLGFDNANRPPLTDDRSRV